MIFQTYDPFENHDLAEKTWKAMQDKSPHSYFTSWGWISTWIKSLPPDSEVRLIVGYRSDDPVLAFFIGNRRRLKYGFLPTRTLSLNTTGEPYYDLLFIEYNSVLSDEAAGPVVNEFMGHVRRLDWDEFVLPGVSLQFVSDCGIGESSHCGTSHVVIDQVCNSYYVDLEKIRAMNLDFMKLLSANKRSQIRRSIRQYELDGELTIEESATADQALAMFEDLVVLHQDEWNKRKKPGSFSNKYVYQFHRDLIRNRFSHGEIQLLEIKNRKKTIGILYCFVYHKQVLFYQSGFNYSLENVYRPGLVSHYYAIVHNAKRGMETYDFLAGESAYKSSLSTDSIPMYWMRLIKSHSRLSLEKGILGVKKHMKSMQGRLKRLGN